MYEIYRCEYLFFAQEVEFYNYQFFYGSFTSKLMYMQNIKEIWIHACRTYMVNFWSLQIIDVKYYTSMLLVVIMHNVFVLEFLEDRAGGTNKPVPL